MPRAIWSGSISFGLVNIPVKVVTAVSDKEIHFHMLHAKDGARIKFKRVCPKEEVEVDNADIVRGYEVGRGEYVTFTDAELAAADPSAARTIDISEFVALDEIDPSYYDKAYYLVPDKNADKPYALLLAALQKTEKVGIAKVVMRDKEYLVAIRAKGEALMMETMHFAEEVVAPETVTADLKVLPKDVDRKQLALAQELIASLTEEFDPARHANSHREKVLAMVEAKIKGHKVVNEPAAPAAAKAMDLVSALESSLAKARTRANRAQPPAALRRPRPAAKARKRAHAPKA